MNFEYRHLVPQNFTLIQFGFTGQQVIPVSEALQIEKLLEDCENWKSHGVAVKVMQVYCFGQFIIIVADQSNRRDGCKLR